MKRMLNSLLVAGVLMLPGACSHDHPGSRHLAQLSWLSGKWANITPEGESGETWKKQNDSTYTGMGYFVKGTDTLFSEKLWLGYVDGTLCYLPTIADQNNGQPVTFRLKTLTDTSMVFENPAHDFPQLISYVLFRKDSLVAQISGTKDGQQRMETFPMRKVK